MKLPVEIKKWMKSDLKFDVWHQLRIEVGWAYKPNKSHQLHPSSIWKPVVINWLATWQEALPGQRVPRPFPIAGSLELGYWA